LGHFCMVALKSWHTPYFRFRKILPPSPYSPVTYSKPTSINLRARSALKVIRGNKFIVGQVLIKFLPAECISVCSLGLCTPETLQLQACQVYDGITLWFSNVLV
jgi:hypothetical protein